MSSKITEPFYFARQPILDPNGHIVAYELLYRSSTLNHAGRLPLYATEQVLVNALNLIGLSNLIEPGERAFLNIDETILFDETLHAVPKEFFVLELLEEIVFTPRIVERVGELHRQGFRFALDDVECSTETMRNLAPVLPFIDVVKLDLPQSLEQARPYVERFRSAGIRVLAEKVETREEFEAFRDIGCELFQGFFFARPTIISGARIDPKLLLIFRMIELLDHDAHDEVIRLFEQDAALTVQMLRYINSAAFSFKSDIRSIRQAVALLGDTHLRHWLTIISYVIGSAEGSRSPLLKLAQERATIMRLLAERYINADEGDTAAFIGLISLIDAIFQKPLPELLQELRIDQELTEILLGESHSQMADLFRIVRSVERFDYDTASPLLERHDILPGALGDVLRQSYEHAELITRNIQSALP